MTERVFISWLCGVIVGLFLGMVIHTIAIDNKQYGKFQGVKEKLVIKELMLDKKRTCPPNTK